MAKRKTKSTVETAETRAERINLVEQYNYEHIKWLAPSDLENHPLLNAKTIVVDIETQTETQSENWDGKNKFGTSYAADITLVAMQADGYPTTVIDFLLGENPSVGDVERIRGLYPDAVIDPETYKIEMPGCEPMTVAEQYELRKEFCRRVLCRPDITIVGHNVVFDLRALGGHFGFSYYMNPHPMVWDTMTMGNMLMLSVVGKQMSLEYQASTYDLLGDQAARDFYYRMKDVRFELHTAVNEDLIRYGATDVQVTDRLYKLHKAVIATSDKVNLEPRSEWDESGNWSIRLESVEGRPNRFASTKNWNNLPTLVDWELRKLWLSAAMAMQGITLDFKYVMSRHKFFTDEYAGSMQKIMDMMLHDHTHDEMTNWLIPYAIYHYWPKNSNVESWVYAALFFSQSPEDFDPSEDVELFKVSQAAVDAVREWLPPEHTVNTLQFTSEQAKKLAIKAAADKNGERNTLAMMSAWMWDRTPAFRDDPDGGWKATLKADWYIRFLTLRKQEEPSKLVNKVAFKSYYVYVLQAVVPPSNEILKADTFLVTDALKRQIDEFFKLAQRKPELLEDEPDWRGIAMYDGAFAMSDKAFIYYFGDPEEDEDLEIDPLRQITHNLAKVTRAEEFMRHAGRDGKIHSVVAPKAITSRATHNTPNIGNLPMAECKGYLVVDDPTKYVQFSIDLSNAENWMSGLTFGDNTQAEACASGDYHMAMLENYKYRNADGSFTDEYIHMRQEIAAGTELGEKYAKRLKAERKWYKRITFASNYGAGAYKISRTMQIAMAQAQEILDRRNARFAATTLGKEAMMNRVQAMWDKGNPVPCITLWTGRRIPIEVTTDQYGKSRPAAYLGINYAQQGGVAEVVFRGMILAQEEAIDKGMSLRIVGQVHDEVVGQCLIEEFWDCVMPIIKHMQEAIPKQYLERTVPAIRMLSAIGPENAEKWGFDNRRDYPIDKTKFANYWGIHDMPEGEHEAPTWIGDMNAGYTIEGEIIERSVKSAQVNGDQSIEVEKLPAWSQFNRIYNDLFTTVRKLEDLRTPATVKVNEKELGPFLLPERMAIMSTMAGRGHIVGTEYNQVWDELGGLLDTLRIYTRWWHQYSPTQTPAEKKAQENQ